jgi:hypothetical protein
MGGFRLVHQWASISQFDYWPIAFSFLPEEIAGKGKRVACGLLILFAI